MQYNKKYIRHIIDNILELGQNEVSQKYCAE